MKNVSIETKLDEADSFAERTKESLSHEEVFARLRAFCSRDCSHAVGGHWTEGVSETNGRRKRLERKRNGGKPDPLKVGTAQKINKRKNI